MKLSNLSRFLAKNAFYCFLQVIIFCQYLLPVSAQSLTSNPAYTDVFLPAPGKMLNLSRQFEPTIIRGIKIFPNDPLKFDFIMDVGQSAISDDQLRDDGSKLIKYFLASLTVPEKDMWVNLSPYEKDRIIPRDFGTTEMGRDLLAQDYILKQITASLMYPEKDLGKKFWEKIRQEAFDKYGIKDVPTDTFNKVWIVPEKAVVYEHGDIAYVVESKLKVMLEEDYYAQKNNEELENKSRDVIKISSAELKISAQIIREIVLPAIEKEVNEGENFINLRQIYNSMILATWFKRNLKQNILNKIYVDQNKISGIDLTDVNVKDKIYQQYLEAFKQGVYNYIKEEYDPITQEIIPHKYFSGGVQLGFTDFAILNKIYEERDSAALSDFGNPQRLREVSARLNIRQNKINSDFALIASLNEIIYEKFSKEIMPEDGIGGIYTINDSSTGEFFVEVGNYEYKLTIKKDDTERDVASIRKIRKINTNQYFRNSFEYKALPDTSVFVGSKDPSDSLFFYKFIDPNSDLSAEHFSFSLHRNADKTFSLDIKRLAPVVNPDGTTPTLKVKTIRKTTARNKIRDDWNTIGSPTTSSHLGNDIMYHPTQEDRFIAVKIQIPNLKNGEGELLIVMDGHGGEDVVNYVRKHIHEEFIIALKATNGEVIQAFQQTIENISLQVKERLRKNFKYSADEFKRQSATQLFDDINSKAIGEGIALTIRRDPIDGLNDALNNPELYKMMQKTTPEADYIIESLQKRRKVPQIEINYLNRLLIELNFPGLTPKVEIRGSGTTLSMTYIPDGNTKAYYAYLGDSPIIIVDKNGNHTPLPEHNVRRNMNEQKRLSKYFSVLNGGYLNNGLGHKSQITKAIGDIKFTKEYIETYDPNIEGDLISDIPDVGVVDLGDQSTVIVTSDGISKPAGELIERVQYGSEAEDITNSVLADSKDNITAIVFRPNIRILANTLMLTLGYDPQSQDPNIREAMRAVQGIIIDRINGQNLLPNVKKGDSTKYAQIIFKELIDLLKSNKTFDEITEELNRLKLAGEKLAISLKEGKTAPGNYSFEAHETLALAVEIFKFQQKLKLMALVNPSVSIYQSGAKSYLRPTGIDGEVLAEQKDSKTGLRDLGKMLKPTEEEMSELLSPNRIIIEIGRYISKYVKNEEKQSLAFKNLKDPRFQNYIERARKKNILLVISRIVDLNQERDKKYMDLLMDTFESIPDELLWETSYPIGWEVTKTERAYGFQILKDSEVGGGGGLTVFEKPKNESWMTRWASHAQSDDFDADKLKSTIVHEVLGHKRSLSSRRVIRSVEGKLVQIPEMREVIMPRKAWIEIARANKLKVITPLNRDQFASMNSMQLKSIDVENLPQEPRELLEQLYNLFLMPFFYYSDILEIVAFTSMGENLRLPFKLKDETIIRNPDHNYAKSREILRRSVNLIGLPVDPTNNVYVSIEFNPKTKTFDRFYFQKSGTEDNPQWLPVEMSTKDQETGIQWKPLPIVEPDESILPTNDLPEVDISLLLNSSITLNPGQEIVLGKLSKDEKIKRTILWEGKPIKVKFGKFRSGLIIKQADKFYLYLDDLSQNLGELKEGAKNLTIIGRGKQSDIKLVGDNTVSHKHFYIAIIRTSQNIYITISDMISETGTTIIGQNSLTDEQLAKIQTSPNESALRIESGTTPVDSAAMSNNKGGIDLNPTNLNLETQGQGIQFDSNSWQELENTPIQGFSPVIIRISPVTNLPLILGIPKTTDLPQSQVSLNK